MEHLAKVCESNNTCSVFYSTFALVLVPGLVSHLRTHAQLMHSSILLSFPLVFSPFSHLATASAIPNFLRLVCPCMYNNAVSQLTTDAVDLLCC